jgi:hypothetical protein
VFCPLPDTDSVMEYANPNVQKLIAAGAMGKREGFFANSAERTRLADR